MLHVVKMDATQRQALIRELCCSVVRLKVESCTLILGSLLLVKSCGVGNEAQFSCFSTEGALTLLSSSDVM